MAKVLVVDDAIDTVRLLSYTLTREGHDVVAAYGGREALELAFTERPDLILLDVMMPEMTGLEVCKRLRQDLALRATPVLLVTAKDGVEDIIAGLDAGADDYVAKPFILEVLSARVRAALRLKESRDAIAEANHKLREAQGEVERAASLAASQRKLRESDERFRSLVETTSDWVWAIDRNGRYTYVSPKSRELLGYEPEELLGKSPLDLMPPEEAERIRPFLADVLANPQPLTGIEKRNLHKGGRCVLLETSGVPLFDAAGNLLGYQGIDRDITARKETEALLRRQELELNQRQAQKMALVGQLAGGVAHEFNNLLQVIGGYTQGVLEEMPPDQPFRDDLQCVLTAAQRAAGLTRQLLGYSRRQMLQPVNANPDDLVSDLGKLVHPLIGEQIALEIVPGGTADLVFVDPGEIQQVLLNLCINARDAMPSGGRLLLTTESVVLDAPCWDARFEFRPGRYAVISVVDTGCGIAADIKDRIFEPFFTTKEVGKGTGLGLSMVHGIVAQHKGGLEVLSQPGRGTTFKIYLPAVARPGEDAAQQPAGPKVEGSETILVAEDDPLVRGLTVRILAGAGFKVLTASDGEEALLLFARHRDQIALLLLDSIMPKLTGHEVYRRVVMDRPDAKVVFCTGYDAATARSQYITDERRRLLVKPFDAQTLLATVREVLDESRPRELAPLAC